MNTFDYPKALTIMIVEPNESFPDEIGVRFSYGNHAIAPANEVVTRLDLAQMKQLREWLGKYIHEIENGFPESGKHQLN